MKNLFKLLFLLLAFQAIAQQEVNTSFAAQINGQVESHQIAVE